jgi:hypothetical protein
LVAIAKKQLKVERRLYEVLQIVSVSAFEQVPLAELLATTPIIDNSAQLQIPLTLNDF